MYTFKTIILHASFGVCLIAPSQLPVQASPCNICSTTNYPMLILLICFLSHFTCTSVIADQGSMVAVHTMIAVAALLITGSLPDDKISSVD